MAVEKIAARVHVSSVRLRGALKLEIEKLLTRFMSVQCDYGEH